MIWWLFLFWWGCFFVFCKSINHMYTVHVTYLNQIYCKTGVSGIQERWSGKTGYLAGFEFKTLLRKSLGPQTGLVLP